MAGLNKKSPTPAKIPKQHEIVEKPAPSVNPKPGTTQMSPTTPSSTSKTMAKPPIGQKLVPKTASANVRATPAQMARAVTIPDIKSTPPPVRQKPSPSVARQPPVHFSQPPSQLAPQIANHHSDQPEEWDMEDVIEFLISSDRGLEPHANTFREHEIDGKAFLMLNSDMMMKYMKIKLGPALKICKIIEQLNNKTKRGGASGSGRH